MSLTRWDPDREMVSLWEGMDRLFEESLVPWRSPRMFRWSTLRRRSSTAC